MTPNRIWYVLVIDKAHQERLLVAGVGRMEARDAMLANKQRKAINEPGAWVEASTIDADKVDDPDNHLARIQ